MAQDPVSLLVPFVREHAVEGDAASVLAAMDKFGWTQCWMMFIGDRKGAHLDTATSSLGPGARVLELGSFCGYSAIRMALQLKPGGHIFSVDFSQPAISIARELVAFAGLSSRITFFQGSSSSWIPRLCSGQSPWPRAQFDMVFLDHHKDLYLPDAQLLVRVGGIATGTVVFADNVIFPGCPDYLEWVRGVGPFSKSTFIPAELEYTARGGRWEVYGKAKDDILEDGIELSVCGPRAGAATAELPQSAGASSSGAGEGAAAVADAWAAFGDGDSDDSDDDIDGGGGDGGTSDSAVGSDAHRDDGNEVGGANAPFERAGQALGSEQAREGRRGGDGAGETADCNGDSATSTPPPS